MRISDRLYINTKDLERSKEIVKELSKLAGELPKIKAQENAAKDELWIIKEALRKSHALFLDDIKELEAAERLAAYKVQEPRKAFGIRCDKLESELKALTIPVCSSAVELFQKELRDIDGLERGRFQGSEKRFTDTQRTEGTEKVMKIETNFDAVLKARGSIMELIGRCRGDLLGESLDKIVKEIQKFEDLFNRIDFAVDKLTEISPSRFKELREVGRI